MLLTKFTMGVGLLWFVVRREWRELAIAAVPAAVICAVSYVFVPQLWADWVDFLTRFAAGRRRGRLDLPSRCGSAWRWPSSSSSGAPRTDRRWTVVVAATLALPVLWIAGVATLVGVVPELRRRSHATGSPEQAMPGQGGIA